MNDKKFLSRYPSLSGKTVVLSGSTGGIGVHLARFLSLLGARLVLLDRNREKAERLKGKLLAEFPLAEIELLTADLSNEASVARAAERLAGEPIDFLILNAGAYKIPRTECECGYNNVFLINYASPFYLIKRLLPTLRERSGRVIAVGSIAHRYSKTDPADIDFSSRQADSLVYGNAKRRLMFSLYSLFGKENGASLSVAHPGITLTNITNHFPKFIFALIKYPMKVIFMPPKSACLSIIEGLFSECKTGEWIGPRVFDIWGSPKKRKLKISQDEIARIAEEGDRVFEKYRAATEENENAAL